MSLRQKEAASRLGGGTMLFGLALVWAEEGEGFYAQCFAPQGIVGGTLELPCNYLLTEAPYQ